jgi:hypothetical protein
MFFAISADIEIRQAQIFARRVEQYWILPTIAPL